jgi:hypothetical protein
MPSAADQEEFEDSPLVEKIRALRKFVNTRRAVLANEPLSNFTKRELEKRGLLGHWAFNGIQSLVDSIPGILVAVCMAAAWPGVTATTEPLQDVLGPSTSPLIGPHTDLLRDKIATVLAPISGPLSFMIIVYVVAYACLPSKYLTIRNWKAAQRRYLYSDAAYGLWPQFFFALSIGLLQVPANVASTNRRAAVVLLTGKILFWSSLLWSQLYTVWRVQADLFYYDYLTPRPEKFGAIRGPSMLKFFGLLWIALPIALNTLSAILDLVATGIAKLLHFLL